MDDWFAPISYTDSTGYVMRITAKPFGVEKVVYNDPATVVMWSDGTKTVVKCHEGDVYDEETGFLLCCAKKLFGNTGKYNDVLAEHVQGGSLLRKVRAIVTRSE